MAQSNHAADAYKVWQPAAEKFDYHMATMAAAVTAWGVQTMTLSGWNLPTGLQGIGLALLGSSTYFSLRRIEGGIQVYRMSLVNATNTDSHSRIVQQEHLNHAMGEIPNLAKISEYENVVKAGKLKNREYAKSVKGHYVWRNRLLLAGLLVYAIGRGWAQIVAAPVPVKLPVLPGVAKIGPNVTVMSSGSSADSRVASLKQ